MKNFRRMELPIQDILRYIIGLVTPDRSVLVGIDGGAGSGKTTFSRWLAENVRQTMTPVSIVHTFNFYRPSAERVNHQFPFAMLSDIDWKRLRDQVIVPLRSGKTARFQLYDWPADRLKDWVTTDVGGVTIIDRFDTVSNVTGFAHSHNLYNLLGGTKLGFPLERTEKIANPLFIDAGTQNFDLQPSSPAIDAGLDLGYSFDFRNYPVPVGTSPNLGAFEHQ